MDFRIIYTTSALADLETIFDWSAVKHPETTPAYLESLLDHVDQLTVFPITGVPANKPVRTRILLPLSFPDLLSG